MSDKTVYEFIRGDDFSIPMSLTNPDNNGTAVDITGWSISSQVRYARKLITDLQVVVTDAAQGQFTIQAGFADTAQWPARDLKCDIQFDRTGGEGRVSSQTFIIRVSEDQTQ